MGTTTNRIRELREAKGLSQDQLASRVHSPTTKMQISRLEKSQRRLTQEWIMRLADALEVHPGELVPDLAPEKLSTQEEQILQLYRGLSEKDQERFRAVADALFQGQEKQSGSEDGK